MIRIKSRTRTSVIYLDGHQKIPGRLELSKGQVFLNIKHASVHLAFTVLLIIENNFGNWSNFGDSNFLLVFH